MRKKLYLILLSIVLNSCFITSVYSQSSKGVIPIKPIRSYDVKIGIVNGKTYYQYNDNEDASLTGKYKIKIMVNDEDAQDIEIIEKGVKKRTLRYDLPNSGYKRTDIDKIGVFNKGYKNGLWKTTHKNKLVKTINYNNGLVIGKYRVYNTKGNILYQTTFGAQGNGKYKDYYYQTGVLKEEGNYENGKKEGEWCSFDTAGKPNKVVVYKTGVPIK